MKNKGNNNFKVGEIVFAKLKGYPWWPAIIKNIQTTSKRLYYTVSFLGSSSTKTSPKIGCNSLVKYRLKCEEMKGKRSKHLFLAIEEAKNVISKMSLEDKLEYIPERRIIVNSDTPDDNDSLQREGSPFNNRLVDEKPEADSPPQCCKYPTIISNIFEKDNKKMLKQYRSQLTKEQKKSNIRHIQNLIINFKNNFFQQNPGCK